ncbi:hypothetical protein BX616_003827 [Lobosporangium transversale]|nr:hypothetical protein BX616_003827 [Lobosporangium transversale]
MDYHYIVDRENHKEYVWEGGQGVRVAPEIISVADKDMIREILITIDCPKSAIYQGFELNGQENLFSTRNKAFYNNRRRLVAPAFGLQHLRSLEPIIHECINVLLRKIDEILDNPEAVKSEKVKVLPPGQINIYSFMIRLSFDITGKTAFGQSFEMVKNDAHPVPHQMAKTLKRCCQQAFNPWMKYVVPIDFSFVEFVTDRVKQRKANGEKDRRTDLLQYLTDAQARERENGNGETGNEYEDMISGKLTDKAVQTEACVFLIAGAETISIVLNFTLMFLVKNPDKLSKLKAELDFAAASNPCSSLPTYDQIRNLPYLTGCIYETLRLRTPPAQGLAREVAEDTVNKYIPERWIPGESPFPPVQDFTYYPFSAGSRNCVGKNLALMELRLILAALILTYDIELVPNQREDYVHYITPSLATGKYIIKMKRRQEE